jgi:hypothetical protein
MQQLADMGIIIPDEYRADMGMPGTWQAVSKPPDGGGGPAEDAKPSHRSGSDKKRKLNNDDEEDEDGSANLQRKGWGSRMKSYPKSGQVDDIAALLGAPIQLKCEGTATKQDDKKIPPSADDVEAETEVKKEDEEGPSRSNKADAEITKPVVAKVEPEVDDTVPSVVFKKRKPKLTKDKVLAT